MSLIFSPMSIGLMSYVDFEKWPCHPVEFKGQGAPSGKVSRDGGGRGKNSKHYFKTIKIPDTSMTCVT